MYSLRENCLARFGGPMHRISLAQRLACRLLESCLREFPAKQEPKNRKHVQSKAIFPFPQDPNRLSERICGRSRQNSCAVHSELELRVNNVKVDPNVTLLHANFLLYGFIQLPFGHHVQDRPFDTR